MGNKAPANPTRALTIAKTSQTYSITSKYNVYTERKVGIVMVEQICLLAALTTSSRCKDRVFSIHGQGNMC